MDLGLRGKTAFVSGSTAGIGLAIATGLAEEGAHVIVNGRTQDRVDQALAHIKSAAKQASLSGVVTDLSTKDGADVLFQKLPAVDVLVNNLGIFEATPFNEIKDEDWLRFFQTNVMSGVRLSRHYLKQMLANNWGRIIFISSESGVNIPKEMIHYGLTKTAQLALSRGIAELTAGTNVTSNCVLPGPTSSEGVSDFVSQLAEQHGQSKSEFEKDFIQKARPTSLLQRMATPEEVANMVVYLCSTRASATNGAAVRADGGVVRSIV